MHPSLRRFLPNPSQADDWDQRLIYELDPVVPQYWERIDDTVTARLAELGHKVKSPFSSALHGVGPEAEIGAGKWGYVYKLNQTTAGPRWALKLTEDPTEGPIAAFIMGNPLLHRMEGCVDFAGVWQLPERSTHGNIIYVIVREFLESTSISHISAHLLSEVRKPAAVYNQGGSWDDMDAARQRTMELLLELAAYAPRAKAVVDFMVEYYRETGWFLADLHAANLGERQRSNMWVAFDVGHSNIDDAPAIDYLPNPGPPVLS